MARGRARSPAATLADLSEPLLPAADPDGGKLIALALGRYGERATRVEEIQQPSLLPLPAPAIELAILAREAEVPLHEMRRVGRAHLGKAAVDNAVELHLALGV